LYGRFIARRLPHALIIGAQKAGTSALFSYLAQHPSLCSSSEKEVDFFGSEKRYAYGFDWYASQWPEHAPGDVIRFEASPQYLFARKAPLMIRRCLPNVRLITILRDPVLRAYSAWQMYRQQLAADPHFYQEFYRVRYTEAEVTKLVRRTNAELDDFWLAVQREAECLASGRSMDLGVLELGLYGPQLARYLELFPREQLLILDSSDLRTSCHRTLNLVLEHLGLADWDWSRANLSEVFVGKGAGPMPARARDFLREYYAESNRMLSQMTDTPPLFVQSEARILASA
jgi:hypothetical protein